MSIDFQQITNKTCLCCFCNWGCGCNKSTTTVLPVPQYIPGPIGPRGYPGPQGIQGPTGATGPQGPSGVNDSLYAESGSQSVDSGGQIPITLSASTTNTTLSLSNNAVSLPAGTYLISFGGTALSSDGTLIGVQLYLNGVAQANQNLLDTASATEYGTVSKTMVLTQSTASTLSIVNSSPATSAYTNAYITVTHLA